MSTTPSSLFGRRTAGSGRPRRRGRLLLKVALGVVVLLALLVAGVSWYASTPQFANKVRTELLIKGVGDSSGGRGERGAFRWSLLHLQVEADNLTIHGLEVPGEAPYLHLDRLLVRVKIISLFEA